MKHLTRDFLTMVSASCPGTNMYALAIFLANCGGFVQIGQSNFDISAPSIQLAHGISASINFVGAPTDVSLPTGSYVVSAADVNRILVLKSNGHARSNSGLFRITGYSSVANTVTVDYRTVTSPPTERFMSWALYENELTASTTWQSSSNGSKNYGSWNPNGDLIASASRIVMQSPDPSSWQVRLCLESLQDVSGSVPSGFSIAPGFGGNKVGDFDTQPHGQGRIPGHDQKLFLHTALWHNTTSSLYRGMTVGLSPCLTASNGKLWAKGQWRISMMVDDVSGSACIVNNNVSLPVIASSGSGWAAFGLSLDETEVPGQSNLSDASINVARLFVVGSSNAQSNLTWKSQFHVDNNMQVVGWSKFGRPAPGVLSCYSDISNPSDSHVRYLTSSANTPWMNATELLDVEILLGTIDQTLSASITASYGTTPHKISPRRLGRLPFFLQGRANFAQWTTTTDVTSSFYHTKDGVYMEWGGPAPTDAVTSGSNYINLSGSIEQQQGLMPYGAFLPGSDPPPPFFPPSVSDIDATRLRKTYSYYRQVPVNVGVIKGGSNPSKP